MCLKFSSNIMCYFTTIKKKNYKTKYISLQFVIKNAQYPKNSYSSMCCYEL